MGVMFVQAVLKEPLLVAPGEPASIIGLDYLYECENGHQFVRGEPTYGR
jgi:hypothetical protein